MSLNYIPTPVFHGDTYGSTLAIMLFPDCLAKARNWHAKFLAAGVIDAYRDAGHSFEDRWKPFLAALAEVDVSDLEVAKRIRGAGFATDAVTALYALVCTDPETASWNKAIAEVCKRSVGEVGGSETHVRSQLKLFAPVLHLWLARRLSDTPHPRESQLFLDGYAMLFELKSWAASQHAAFKKPERYLATKEYGPWPELANLMEHLGGSWQKRISLSSRSSK